MRIRHHHHTGHHRGHHGGKRKKGSTSKAAERVMLSQGQTSMSQADTQFAELVRQVSSALLTAGWMAEVVSAIEQVVESKMSSAPGLLLPGVISNLAGGVQAATGSAPMLVMVFLNGSTLAQPVYVPPHLVGDVAAGQEVWVRPANGNTHDLILDSIRSFNTAPASASYANTSGSVVAGQANNASNVPASGVSAGNLAGGVKQQNGSTVVGIASAGGGAAGTRIWVGTTDPGGSAGEGDVWIRA